MQVVDTFYANIYIGSRKGYSEDVCDRCDVLQVVQDYCNKEKLGVTVTDTFFMYVDGNEPGYIIGLINYPRFPSENQDIIKHAVSLGLLLLVKLEQERFSVMTPFKTIMLEKEDLGKM